MDEESEVAFAAAVREAWMQRFDAWGVRVVHLKGVGCVRCGWVGGGGAGFKV